MALGLIAATAGQAGAFVIDGGTSVDDTFLMNFELLVGATDDNGNTLGGTEDLTAEMLFTVDAVGGMSVTFTVKVSNTSLVDPAGADAVTSIGFFTDPEVTLSVVTVGTVFTTVEEDPNPSLPGFAEIDICLFANNNCAGGDIYNGLQNLEMDTVAFTLDWSGGALTIAPGAIKFQGERGSFEFTDSDDPGFRVPEPATLLLFGIGLLGLGAVTWRRRKFAA